MKQKRLNIKLSNKGLCAEPLDKLVKVLLENDDNVGHEPIVLDLNVQLLNRLVEACPYVVLGLLTNSNNSTHTLLVV